MLIPKLVIDEFLGTFVDSNELNKFNNKHKVKIPIPGEVWKSVGLAIHKEKETWTISHVDSGCFLLKGIKSKEKAKEYLVKLRKIKSSWKGEVSIKDIKEQLMSMREEVKRCTK